MSSSAAFLIQQNGEILVADEYRNGHGTGPRVWTPMARRFMPPARGYWDVLGKGAEDRKFWDLYKDPSVPRAWRAALLFTFDYAIIEHARFREFAALLRQFSKESEPILEYPHVDHLPAIADLLEKHADDTDVVGACFQMTSVSEDVWHPWDSEKDEGTTYDLQTDCRHFYVGRALDEVEPAQEGAAR